MDSPQTDHEYISAFLRDALRIEASAWLVTNVVRMWKANNVPADAIVSALDEVTSEHPLDPQQIAAYRADILALLDGGPAEGASRATPPADGVIDLTVEEDAADARGGQ
jgi:hypothetical protein